MRRTFRHNSPAAPWTQRLYPQALCSDTAKPWRSGGRQGFFARSTALGSPSITLRYARTGPGWRMALLFPVPDVGKRVPKAKRELFLRQVQPVAHRAFDNERETVCPT